MSTDSVAPKLSALAAARDDPRSAESRRLLTRSLGDRSCRVVARAAEIIADAEIAGCEDELLTAYRRLLRDPLKTDPGCAGKTAILRALVTLERKDPDLFRQAVVYEQREPVWDRKLGYVDVAAELRGIAAAGLVNCVTSQEVLNRCVTLLVDEWHLARAGAAHAIGILGQLEGIPLLRLKLLTGDERPEVIGSCCAALLRLDRTAGVEFVAGFAHSRNENVCIQAALALAESRRPGVFEVLRSAWQTRDDAAVRDNLLVCIGLVRSAEAHDFLLSLIANPDLHVASEALTVLKTCAAVSDLSARTAAAVEATGNPRLLDLLRKDLPENPVR